MSTVDQIRILTDNVKYDEKLYKVERTYRTDEYYIELSCSEVE